MRKIYLIAAIIALAACSKTPILEASDSMVGTWEHFTDEDDSHTIIINEDGTGHMEWQIDGTLSRSTKVRDWYLDDNVLSFGKAAFNGESYEIDDYPAVAWEEIIKYYDTIPELSRYIVLDGNYYVEK